MSMNANWENMIATQMETAQIGKVLTIVAVKIDTTEMVLTVQVKIVISVFECHITFI